jgi:sRNA-binding protein
LKEQFLEKVEAQKQKIEEEKERQRDSRHAEHKKRRSLETLATEAEQKNKVPKNSNYHNYPNIDKSHIHIFQRNSAKSNLLKEKKLKVVLERAIGASKKEARKHITVNSKRL